MLARRIAYWGWALLAAYCAISGFINGVRDYDVGIAILAVLIIVAFWWLGVFLARTLLKITRKVISH